MFRNFWEKNDLLLKFLAGFSAVAALFLAIPTGSLSNEAKESLMNLQMLLLFVIMGVIMVVLYKFLRWVIYDEMRLWREESLWSFGMRSAFVFGIALWITVNLWRFVFFFNRDAASLLLSMFLLPGLMVIATVILIWLEAGKKRTPLWKELVFGAPSLGFIVATSIAVIAGRFDHGPGLRPFLVIFGICAIVSGGLFATISLFWAKKKKN